MPVIKYFNFPLFRVILYDRENTWWQAEKEIAEERDSLYIVFFGASPPPCFCKNDPCIFILHLATVIYASSPAHPRYPCFTSLIALHLRAHWIWKLLRRCPSSASVPYSFSLFFKTSDKESLLLLSRGQSYNLSPCILHPLLLFLSGISTWIYPFTWTMKSSHFSPLLYNSYKLILLTLTCTNNITFKTGKSLNPSTLLLVAFSFFSSHLQQKFLRLVHIHCLPVFTWNSVIFPRHSCYCLHISTEFAY